MPLSQIFLILISGLGVIHGLFLALFLWVYRKGNRLSNKILSLLLVVLSFRIGKSVFLEFAEHLDVKLVFTGLGSLMAIGPLYYFYTRSCIEKDFRLNWKNTIHFIPFLLGIVFGFWINDTHLDKFPILFFLFLFLTYYGHYLIYLLISYSYVAKQKKNGLNQEVYRFLHLLFYGLIIVWMAYVLNLFDELIPYIYSPILYSVVAYLISFIVFRKGYINKIDHKKYKSTQVSDEQIDLIFARVMKLIVDDRQYKNANLTLRSLSEMLNVSTQVLSMIINQRSKVNFNSFINGFRIEESLNMFRNKRYSNHTIASIAFEVGFNSISSFNTAFRNHTNKTPLAYRKSLSK